MSDDTLDTRQRLVKAVLFRANYRGGKEADLILGGFARQEAAQLEEADLMRFAQLLTHDDSEIFAWLDGTKQAPDFLDNALIQKINAYIAHVREQL